MTLTSLWLHWSPCTEIPLCLPCGLLCPPPASKRTLTHEELGAEAQTPLSPPHLCCQAPDNTHQSARWNPLMSQPKLSVWAYAHFAANLSDQTALIWAVYCIWSHQPHKTMVWKTKTHPLKHHPTSAGVVWRWDERVGSGVTDEFSGIGVSPHTVTLFLDRSTQELWCSGRKECNSAHSMQKKHHGSLSRATLWEELQKLRGERKRNNEEKMQEDNLDDLACKKSKKKSPYNFLQSI